MKAAVSAGTSTRKRAVAPKGSSFAVMSSRATIRAVASTWPVTRWPPSSSPILSERSRFTLVPAFHSPSVVKASVSAAASTSNQEPREALSPGDDGEARPGAGDRGAERDALGRIARMKAKPLQRALFSADLGDLADIGHDAGEHGRALDSG